MSVIDSLVAKLSFEFDSKGLDKFNKGMKEASKAIAVVATASATASTAIFAFTNKIAKKNDEIGKFSQKIGITSQALKELGFVAKLNGSDVSYMNSSLEKLSISASEASRGLGAGIEAFGILGVSVTDAQGRLKDTDKLLLDVADSISKLSSQSEKIELLNKIGIDSSLLLTIEQGSKSILNQRKELEKLGFVLDKNATAYSAKFNDEMLRVSTVVKGVASSVGTKLMKQIIPMIDAFLQWFKINKKLIKQKINSFFDKTIKAITAFYNIAKRVANVVNSIVTAMGGLDVALGAVAVSLMAVNARALMVPVVVFAIASSIFLLIEDMVAFANGADSQIGAIADKFPAIGVAVNRLIDIFSLASDGWKMIFKDGDKALDGLIFLIKDVGKSIKDFIMSPINAVLESFNDMKNKANSIAGNVEDFLGGEVEKVYNFFDATEPKKHMLALPNNNNISNTNTNDIVININGGNTDDVKRAVSDALNLEFKSTEINMSTGVMY